MGKITLSVKPAGKGSFTKYAEVTTNDPQNQNFKLTLKFESFLPKGYRLGSFLIDPGDEISGEIAQGPSYETKVNIYYDREILVKITKAVSDKENFDIQLETAQEGKRYVVVVKSAASLPVGLHKQKVKLLTDDPNQPEIELNLSLKVSNAK